MTPSELFWSVFPQCRIRADLLNMNRRDKVLVHPYSWDVTRVPVPSGFERIICGEVLRGDYCWLRCSAPSISPHPFEPVRANRVGGQVESLYCVFRKIPVSNPEGGSAL